ncbi:alpha/beta hydrolase [Actinomadura luteofluorescens]|uniref:alpha/beta fold hydrolase n=1 Tax=Actinomadura luteofluorescens TaxID=46163 RepID=UPI0021649E00|nr:alpha/beta hydrolase [Actinomadura glauciflava]
MPRVDGVEHRFVEARGIRFHVAGAGEGPPLMFVHGFPQHWYAWRHLVPLLADRYRLVMPDLRGAGWSDAPYRGYGTRDRAADVLALMDALGLDRVGLIGHEWGAWAGFRACLDAPDRFTRFLALNIVHPWPDQRAIRRNAWRMWYTALWEYPLLGGAVLRHWPGFTRYHLRRGVTDPTSWRPGELEEFVDSVRSRAHAHAGRALHWQYVLRDIPALATGRFRHERLAVPATVLLGAGDFAFVPEMLTGGDDHADELDARIVPGGHYLADERPELVAATIQELFPTESTVQRRPQAPQALSPPNPAPTPTRARV